MKYQSALLLATLFIAPLSFAADDPFGFDIDVSPTNYDYCSLGYEEGYELGTDQYLCKSAPKPHGEFTNYLLWFVDGVGLCKVIASGRLFHDSFGHKTKRKMEEIKEQLKKKYGEPSSHDDYLEQSVIESRERNKSFFREHYGADNWERMEERSMGLMGPHWMEEIYKKERRYSYYWLPPEYKRVGNVESIQLEPTAISSYDARIKLSFEYPNLDTCLKRHQDKQSDAF